MIREYQYAPAVHGPIALSDVDSKSIKHKAQEKGIKFGRKPALSAEQRATIQRLRAKESFTIAQLMERFQVGRTTIYRALGSAS